MKILKARKILKNKIIGITCHNSINLAKKAIIIIIKLSNPMYVV